MPSDYSSNHSHITGDFGEHLILYWLSKNGYECVHVNHIGVDILASKDGKRIGISVKSRSRKEGIANNAITISNPLSHIEKVKETCLNFDCEEYFAFIIDQLGTIKVVITPLEVVEENYKFRDQSQDWNIQKFEKHKKSIVFELKWL